MAENSVKFIIGGEEVEVPALNFAALEKAEPDIRAISTDLPTIQYTGHVLNIVAVALRGNNPGRDVLADRLRGDEMAGLISAMNALLEISGFARVGEAEAVTAQNGTGTLSASPPNSPPMTSAAETLSE